MRIKFRRERVYLGNSKPSLIENHYENTTNCKHKEGFQNTELQ